MIIQVTIEELKAYQKQCEEWARNEAICHLGRVCKTVETRGPIGHMGDAPIRDFLRGITAEEKPFPRIVPEV